MAALLLSCVEIPVALAFGPTLRDDGLDDGLTISLLVIDIILCIDILITFRTGYYDKNKDKYIDDPIEIAKKYIRFWFFIDFMTSFPFGYATSNYAAETMDGYAEAIKLIRIFRLVRIVRLSRLVDLTRMASSFPPGFIRKVNIAKIVFLMIYIAHCFACLFYAVGEWGTLKGDVEISWIIKAGLDGDDVSNWSRYSTSLYWAVITLFTTGYGDIVATNIYEQWVCILCVFLGSCVSAWFIGSFSALVLEGDTTQRSEHDAIVSAQSFCNHYNIDDNLRRAVELHTRYYYKRHNYLVSAKDEVMEKLPLFLQNDIKKKLALASLKNSKLFKGLDDAVIGSLMLNVKSVACNEKCSLFQKNEVANELYICTQGISQLIKEDVEGKEDDDFVKRKYMVCEGDIVGEYCLRESYRKYTLRCNSWSEFWRIRKCDIHNCIFAFYGKKKGQIKWDEMISKLKGKRKRRKVKFQNLGWQQKIFKEKKKKNEFVIEDEHKHDFREDEELKQVEVEMLELPQSEDEIDLSYDDWSESSRIGNLFRNDRPNLGKSVIDFFKKKKKPRNSNHKANELVQRAHSRHKEYAAASSDTSHSDIDSQSIKTKITELKSANAKIRMMEKTMMRKL